MVEPFSSDSLQYFDNTSDAWDSRVVRKLLRKTWSEWLSMRKWCVFLTLTFRDETYPETALKKLNYLIRMLNEETFGKHYTNYVGHSYFSYVASIEYQKRDVIHFHVLIDRPVNFRAIHKYWNYIAGFAKVELVQQNENAVYYVTKYVAKCGEMGLPYFAKKIYTPPFIPNWWKEQENAEVEENDQENILS
ncbi:MAG: hypothetical protein P9L97_00240 [Candidatus Tenebribacter davisii]|nr:hypothetical protein [Candidatus Tenebribacter davisii]